jgi:hypothetical protein
MFLYDMGVCAASAKLAEQGRTSFCEQKDGAAPRGQKNFLCWGMSCGNDVDPPPHWLQKSFWVLFSKSTA